MNLSNIQRIVKNIKKSLFKNFSLQSLGMMKSSLKGMGIQFKEHKVYVYGDDVRFIDWKVFAKTNTPYVKTFEQERNLEILVVLDAGCSMTLGYKGISKLQVAIDITILLYFLAQETKDKVHTVIMGDEIIDIPKSEGKEGLVYFIAECKKMKMIDNQGKVLKSYSPKKDVSEEDKLKFILKTGLKRKEVIFLSDFFNFLPKDHLYDFLSQRNIYGVKILSPINEMPRFPFDVFGFKASDLVKRHHGIFSSPEVVEENLKVQGLKKKLKEVRVSSTYLDDFVKEMMR